MSSNREWAEQTSPSSDEGTKASSMPTITTKRILSLALPSLGALIAEPLFTVIDSTMVGHLGTPQLAGLGVAATVLNTAVGLFIFLAYSTTSLAGRHLGAGRRDLALRSGVEAMWLAGGFGVVAAVLLALFASPLLSWLGADATTLPHALAYLRASAPGLVGMFVVLAATGTLRGLQDTRTPLVAASAGAAFNAVANWTLMYPLGLGVAGSGLGTAITQTLMAVFLAWIIVRAARRQGVSLRPSTSGLGGAAVEGTPLLVRTLALRVALLATLSAVTAISTQALAAHQIVWTLWSFAAYVLDALAIAAQALAGFASGTGQRGAIQPILRTLSRWGVSFGVAVGVVLAFAAPWITLIFTTDQTVIDYATVAIIVSAVFQPVAGYVFLLDGILIGAGRGRYLAGVSVLNLVVYAPLLWLIAHSATLASTPSLALALVWLAYSAVYTGMRALTNGFGARSL